ncbi:MAG TPA: glycosyltransferase family 4 protein [Nitrospira sp.]|nr:glycosyltransferase family 4 protein [Nitrospira sp.]
MTGRPRLLYLITEDWYFWSHRLDLARAARDAGFDVAVATRVGEYGDRIEQEGFRLIPISLLRKSRNLLSELQAVAELVRVYRVVRPHLVHHVAMKPILYGSLAAWIVRVPVVLNAFAGLGYVFTDRERQREVLPRMMRKALKVAIGLNRSTVLFQNEADRDELITEGLVPAARTRIIAGSGVDTTRFSLRPAPSGIPLIVLPSRMLWDKGVGEFVQAARELRVKGVEARFALVGRCDEDNPAAIPRTQLDEWGKEGVVEWWGHREDMASVYGAATVVVLPSYREGLPKVLLEAAACGKAIVAADVPGCRDVVRHRATGILVSPRNSAALAAAIEELLVDHRTREAMGSRGRELVAAQWSVPAIAGQMVNLYHELLNTASAGHRSHGYA